ncbi:MAG: PilZ domain-containing protein [Candidatus Hydrogenedentales bacterium]|jgi:c-di-GMP-binding flagellar brake protein YcgR
MTDAAMRNEEAPDLSKGRECLVVVMGQHFLGRILDAAEDRLTLTFPGTDYPTPGMQLQLQFHDEEGFNSYIAVVVAGPQENAGCVVVERPVVMERILHRQNCRVPTDLTVQIREGELVRQYDAALVNLSAGGALLETDAPLDLNSSIEMTISIPLDTVRTIHGRVTHIERLRPPHDSCQFVVGMCFGNMDTATTWAIKHYVWQRLHELYPGH